jgi:hypothetical protein
VGGAGATEWNQSITEIDPAPYRKEPRTMSSTTPTIIAEVSHHTLNDDGSTTYLGGHTIAADTDADNQTPQSAATGRPTFAAWSRDHVDELTTLARQAIDEKPAQGSPLIMHSPWGDLEVGYLASHYATLFAAGHRTDGLRARDRGGMIDPDAAPEVNAKRLRTICMRADKLNA